MRSVISVLCAASLLVVQIPAVGFAQGIASSTAHAQIPTVSPAKVAEHRALIAQQFKAFPNGGDSLKLRIADLIVKDPQAAVELVKYVRFTKTLTYPQRVATERGIAAALERMGVMAADMPAPVYKAAPAVMAPPVDYSWLIWVLAAGGIVGGLCLADVICDNDDDNPVIPKPVSPN